MGPTHGMPHASHECMCGSTGQSKPEGGWPLLFHGRKEYIMELDVTKMKALILTTIQRFLSINKNKDWERDAIELRDVIKGMDVEAYYQCASCLEERPYPPARINPAIDLIDENGKIDMDLVGPICGKCASVLDGYISVELSSTIVN